MKVQHQPTLKLAEMSASLRVGWGGLYLYDLQGVSRAVPHLAQPQVRSGGGRRENPRQMGI